MNYDANLSGDGVQINPSDVVNPHLLSFHQNVKDIIEQGLVDARLLLASVQLQLEKDHATTMAEKLDVLVQTGQLCKQGDRYIHPKYVRKIQ